MEDRFVENQSFGIWLIILGAYVLLSILTYISKKRGWVRNRNYFIGFRSIMSGRSELTWKFANKYFLKFFFYITNLSMLIHVCSFIITLNPELAFAHSRSFFGIFFILLIVTLEATLFVKFNWNGTPR